MRPGLLQSGLKIDPEAEREIYEQVVPVAAARHQTVVAVRGKSVWNYGQARFKKKIEIRLVRKKRSGNDVSGPFSW